MASRHFHSPSSSGSDSAVVRAGDPSRFTGPFLFRAPAALLLIAQLGVWRNPDPAVRPRKPYPLVEGRKLYLAAPEVAGVPPKILGEPVAGLAAERRSIVEAPDLLVTGI